MAAHLLGGGRTGNASHVARRATVCRDHGCPGVSARSPPAENVLSVSPDTDLFLWTLSWDTYAFTHHPFSIFDANIFFPQRLTLAYSENLIGSAIFAAPILWLTHNPVLAMNLVALLSCVLCGVGAYVLARRAGVGLPGAALSGLIFAFTPPRFLRLDQLFLTTIQWVPFGLAYVHAYLDEGRPFDVRMAIAFFTLQALTSGHGAVFLALAATALIGYRLMQGEPLSLAKRLRDVGAVGVLLLAPVVLIALAYARVQAEMGLKRTLADWLVVSPASFWLRLPTCTASCWGDSFPTRTSTRTPTRTFSQGIFRCSLQLSRFCGRHLQFQDCLCGRAGGPVRRSQPISLSSRAQRSPWSSASVDRFV